MKKRMLSLLLCLSMFIPMLTVPTSASATKINVSEVNYYEDSGDVESLSVDFGWDTASATSRLTVMTKRLRSAGESGTSKSYGDFTDYGYYGKSFKTWKDVLAKSDTFGMLYYTNEQKINTGKTNNFTVNFDEGDIPLDVNQTYYLYLWTYYAGHYYPDNLFMVLQVKDGEFKFAPATGRNSHGSFTTLWHTVSEPEVKAPKFSDVKDSDYFAKPVNWAVEKKITSGTGADTFSPNMTCTRAQILTFLWQAAGAPNPTTSFRYSDVKESDYFYKPALWAKEKGIYNPGGSVFEPNTPCTRGSTVEYLWRIAGSKQVDRIPFSDVAAGNDLDKAVSWAVNYGVTSGSGGTTFSPDSICTRGQIVTFLYAYYVSPADNSALIANLKKAAS